MACNDSISNICVETIKAPCISYEGKLSANTTITESCVNQYQVNEDLYTLIDNITTPTSNYVSNVQLAGTNLTFTAVGSAFGSTVDLSSLDNSSLTLQQVSDNGATTTNDLTAPNFVLSSDERLKTHIEPIYYNSINVNWRQYRLKDNITDIRYGVIAQELEVEHPEFIKTDSEGIKSVKYIDLLVAKIAQLESELEEIKIKLM